MEQPILWIAMLAIFPGILLHLAKRLYDLEQTGTILSPLAFIRMHPYQYVLMVLSSAMLVLLLHSVAQLTYATAILIGVAGDSVYDTLRSKAIKKIKADETDQAGA